MSPILRFFGDISSITDKLKSTAKCTYKLEADILIFPVDMTNILEKFFIY